MPSFGHSKAVLPVLWGKNYGALRRASENGENWRKMTDSVRHMKKEKIAGMQTFLRKF